MRLLHLSISTILSILICFPLFADTGTSTTTLTIAPSASSGNTITAADENSRNNDTSTTFDAHVHRLSNTTNFGDGTAGNKFLCADAADGTDSCIRWDDANDIWQVDSPAGIFNEIAKITEGVGLAANAIVMGGGAGVISALVDGLGSSGEFLQSQGAGSEPQWAVQGFARAGGNTTEATDNSGAAADILTVSNLSIAATVPFIIVANLRKTGGAAAASEVGLKINTAQIVPNEVWSTASDVIDQAHYFVIVGPRVSTFVGAVLAIGSDSIESSGGPGFISGATSTVTTDTITEIIITGDTNNSSVTMGVDEVHVYTLPTS